MKRFNLVQHLLIISGLTTVTIPSPAFAQNGTWTTKAPMPTARASVGSAEVNGRLYVVGGSDSAGAALTTVEAYDPLTDTWSPKPSMSTARAYADARAVNGTLYAFGGFNSSSGFLQSVEDFGCSCCPGPQGPPGPAFSGMILHLAHGSPPPSGFTFLGTSDEAYKTPSGNNTVHISVDVYQK